MLTLRRSTWVVGQSAFRISSGASPASERGRMSALQTYLGIEAFGELGGFDRGRFLVLEPLYRYVSLQSLAPPPRVGQ